MPGLQPGLQTAAAAKVTAAVVATEQQSSLLQLQFADAAANLAAHCRWLHCMCIHHSYKAYGVCVSLLGLKTQLDLD